MFVVGDRVAIDSGTRLGTLRFLGPTKFRVGVWAGIELDEPTGKHDGMVDNVRYFTCRPGHGLFVHPTKLTKPINEVKSITRDPLPSTPKRLPQLMQPKSPAIATRTRNESIYEVKNERSSLKTKEGEPFSRPESGISGTTGISTIFGSFAIDKYSISDMEVELEKRKQDLNLAKQEMETIRLQISDPQSLEEYIVNRDKLLSAVDNFERASQKYERQLRRVGYLHVRNERNKVKEEGTLPSDFKSIPEEMELKEQQPNLADGPLQKRLSTSRINETEKIVEMLEEQLDASRKTEDILQKQIRQQSSISAELSVERNQLRKEVNDLRNKLKSLVDGQRNVQEMRLVSELEEETKDLHDELSQKSKEIAQLKEEKHLVVSEQEKLLRDTSVELEALKRESAESLGQFERKLKQRDDTNKELEAQLKKLNEIKLRLDRQMSDHRSDQELQRLQAEVGEKDKIIADYERLMKASNLDSEQMQELMTSREEELSNLSQRLREKEATLKETIKKLQQEEDKCSMLRQRLEDGEGSLPSEQVENLKKERELLANQVNTLQRKLIEFQDSAQIEAKYRAQFEAMRKNTEDNWNRFNAEVAEKDAKIEELTNRISTLIGQIRDAPATKLIPSSQELVERSERLSRHLEELQQNYSELYKSKQTQERYFMRQIGKLNRRLASVLKTNSPEIKETADAEEHLQELNKRIDRVVLEHPAEELSKTKVQLNRALEERDRIKVEYDQKIGQFANDSAREEMEKNLKEAQNKLDVANNERKVLLKQISNLQEKLRHVETLKEKELLSIQGKLDRANEEKARLMRELDSSSSMMPNKTAEIEVLREEIEVIISARDNYASKLNLKETRLKEVAKELEDSNKTIDNLRGLLDQRTDELARLEVKVKDNSRAIKSEEELIEQLKSEHQRKTKTLELEKDSLKRKIDDLQIQVKNKERIENELSKVTSERDHLLEEIHEMRKTVNKLETDLNFVHLETLEAQKKRLAESETQLLGAESKIRLMESELSQVKKALNESNLENRNLNEQLSEVQLNLEQQIQKASDEKQQLASQLRALNQKIPELEREISEKQKRLRTLEKNLGEKEREVLNKELKAVELLSEAKDILTNDISVETADAVLVRSRPSIPTTSTATSPGELEYLRSRVAKLEAEKKQLQLSLAESENEKERIHNALLKKSNELSQLQSQLESKEKTGKVSEGPRPNVDLEKEEKDRKLKEDMIELAEQEMNQLQARIAHLEELDQQRRTLLVKFQAQKEELRLAEDRLNIKEEEIKELKSAVKNLQVIPSELIKPASSSSSPYRAELDENMRRMESERDHLVKEREHMNRMLKSIEHEKMLLESELQIVKQSLQKLKEDTGVKLQQDALQKAGKLLSELQSKQEVWTGPVKSVASFLHLYKPAEVDLDKLQEEYDQILRTLGPHGLPQEDIDKVSLLLDQKLAVPSEAMRRIKVCAVCKRSGHDAVQCDSVSDTLALPLDSGDGFSQTNSLSQSEPRAFSA